MKDQVDIIMNKYEKDKKAIILMALGFSIFCIGWCVFLQVTTFLWFLLPITGLLMGWALLFVNGDARDDLIKLEQNKQ